MTYQPNVENISKLIKLIEGLNDDQLSMEDWLLTNGGTCGTVGCIGGWSEFIIQRERGLKDGTTITVNDCVDWLCTIKCENYWETENSRLNLSDDLFFMWSSKYNIGDFISQFKRETQRQIVLDVLRHFMITGVVDWDTFIEQRM